MARNAKSKRFIVQRFDSVASIASDMSQSFTLGANADRSMKIIHDGIRHESWFGVAGKTAADVIRMGTVDGWPDGAAEMALFHERMGAKLPQALGFMRTKRRGPQGDELDVHATLRGQHDKAWTHSQRTIKKGSGILRLCVDVAGNCSQPAEHLKWRGIAGASLAEVMRKAGYSVEIEAVLATESPDAEKTINTYTAIVVKNRKASTDFGQLAATIGMTGFYRVFGFHSMIRACDNAGVIADSGLGYYLIAESIAPLDPKVTTLFVSPDVMCEETATTWVKRSVALLQGARA